MVHSGIDSRPHIRSRLQTKSASHLWPAGLVQRAWHRGAQHSRTRSFDRSSLPPATTAVADGVEGAGSHPSARGAREGKPNCAENADSLLTRSESRRIAEHHLSCPAIQTDTLCVSPDLATYRCPLLINRGRVSYRTLREALETAPVDGLRTTEGMCPMSAVSATRRRRFAFGRCVQVSQSDGKQGRWCFQYGTSGRGTS